MCLWMCEPRESNQTKRGPGKQNTQHIYGDPTPDYFGLNKEKGGSVVISAFSSPALITTAPFPQRCGLQKNNPKPPLCRWGKTATTTKTPQPNAVLAAVGAQTNNQAKQAKQKTTPPLCQQPNSNHPLVLLLRRRDALLARRGQRPRPQAGHARRHRR